MPPPNSFFGRRASTKVGIEPTTTPNPLAPPRRSPPPATPSPLVPGRPPKIPVADSRRADHAAGKTRPLPEAPPAVAAAAMRQVTAQVPYHHAKNSSQVGPAPTGAQYQKLSQRKQDQEIGKAWDRSGSIAEPRGKAAVQVVDERAARNADSGPEGGQHMEHAMAGRAYLEQSKFGDALKQEEQSLAVTRLADNVGKAGGALSKGAILAGDTATGAAIGAAAGLVEGGLRAGASLGFDTAAERYNSKLGDRNTGDGRNATRHRTLENTGDGVDGTAAHFANKAATFASSKAAEQRRAAASALAGGVLDSAGMEAKPLGGVLASTLGSAPTIAAQAPTVAATNRSQNEVSNARTSGFGEGVKPADGQHRAGELAGDDVQGKAQGGILGAGRSIFGGGDTKAKQLERAGAGIEVGRQVHAASATSHKNATLN